MGVGGYLVFRDLGTRPGEGYADLSSRKQRSFSQVNFEYGEVDIENAARVAASVMDAPWVRNLRWVAVILALAMTTA